MDELKRHSGGLTIRNNWFRSLKWHPETRTKVLIFPAHTFLVVTPTLFLERRFLRRGSTRAVCFQGVGGF